MENYKPNSNKWKAEHQDDQTVMNHKVDKVISGTAKVKKKSDIHKFADVFLSDDVSNVKSYILLDVFVPALKDLLMDIVSKGASMILYGDSSRSKNNTPGSKVSYRGYYQTTNQDRNRTRERRNSFDFDDIILNDRGEAEGVLGSMDELIDIYGVCSVGDFYDLVGIQPDSNYMVNKYGWTNLKSARAVPVRGGYLLKLPRPMPID